MNGFSNVQVLGNFFFMHVLELSDELAVSS